MEIRILNEEELVNAAGLSRYVFDTCLRDRMEFVQTISFIESYISADNLRKMQKEETLILWGAFEQEQMVAVSALQSDGMITMLYVLPQFMRKGIGKKMLVVMREYARDKYGLEQVCLNATPAFTSFYFKNQGFEYMDAARTVHVPFVSMCATSNAIANQKRERITGKMIAAAVLACLSFATIATSIYMIFYLF